MRVSKRRRVVALIWLFLWIATFSAPVQAQEAIADGSLNASPGSPPVAPRSLADTLGAAANTQQTAPVFAHTLYLPISVVTSNGLVVTPQDKDASTDFYHRYYADSDETDEDANNSRQVQVAGAMRPQAVDPNWTGDHAACDAGDVSQEFRDAVLLRINYFRAMAGVPANVEFSDDYNRMAQQAALMMSANDALNHEPNSTWDCYTEDGARAAGSSNLFLGIYAWDAISGYIQDPGGGNVVAGHRRWILYPQTHFMGTGDIPRIGGYRPANALWVFDEHIGDPRPTTREEFVAWPPPGYTPYQVTFPLWSFAYANADFSNTSVHMTAAGDSMPLTLFEIAPGFGENAVTWEPDIELGQPALETTYHVQINNVVIEGNARDFSYDVIVFDPDA